MHGPKNRQLKHLGFRIFKVAKALKKSKRLVTLKEFKELKIQSIIYLMLEQVLE